VTEIEFDEKDKALEIMMRVFIDDLETALRTKTGNAELDILSPKGGLTADQLIRDYLPAHFSITLDGKPQKTNYLGHEREGDAFILYIEVSNVRKWKTIKVLHDAMTEVFDDQSNLINITVRGNVQSLRLTKDTPVNTLTFETN
jgi:hypothetical protein